MKKNKRSLLVAITFIIFVIALFTVKTILKNNDINRNISTNVINTNNDIENTTKEESIENVIQDNLENKVNDSIIQEEKSTTNKTEIDNKIVENKKELVKEEKEQKMLHLYLMRMLFQMVIWKTIPLLEILMVL